MSSIPHMGGTTRPIAVFEGPAGDQRVERSGLVGDDREQGRGDRRRPPAAGRVHRAYGRARQSDGRRREAVTVGQLMSESVVALPPDGVAAEAAAAIRQRGIHHVPVVDRDGRPIGMVSDRDLLRLPEPGGKVPVATIMSRDLAVARREDDVRDVARQMLDRTVSSVIVVDARGALVGILTSRDILRAVANGAPIELWA